MNSTETAWKRIVENLHNPDINPRETDIYCPDCGTRNSPNIHEDGFSGSITFQNGCTCRKCGLQFSEGYINGIPKKLKLVHKSFLCFHWGKWEEY